MGNTTALIDTGRDSWDGVADELIELLGLRNAETLADELRDDPLGAPSATVQDDKAIETAPRSVAPVALMTTIGSKDSPPTT